jgi:hypothetical protein
MNTTSNTTVDFFQSFSDGSGAPATISSMGLRWTFDTLGAIKYNRLDSRQFVKRGIVAASLKIATKTYQAKIASLGEGWMAANSAMYAEGR